MAVIAASLSVVVAALGIEPARVSPCGFWPRASRPQQKERNGQQEPAHVCSLARFGSLILSYIYFLSNPRRTKEVGPAPMKERARHVRHAPVWVSARATVVSAEIP